jgi:hypothetical protein
MKEGGGAKKRIDTLVAAALAERPSDTTKSMTPHAPPCDGAVPSSWCLT